MNISTNTYDIKYTPDFAYTPISSQSLVHTQNAIEEKQYKDLIHIYVSYDYYLYYDKESKI